MKTQLLPVSPESLAWAATLLQNGEIIGIPTETVYGLAANALDPHAVSKIFAAKGRPQDNPLIVHIDSLAMLDMLTHEPPALAYRLAEAFWSGPLTMVLPRSSMVSDAVTAGLDTVAIRMPSHPAAQQIIKASGLPLAAPSANLSGSPSPTKASHVLNDMNGRIPLIIDGGECSVGLESTVVAVEQTGIRLLRPGGITVEQLSQIANVIIDNGVLHQIDPEQKVSSPGMKYKHYAPKAHVMIVDADIDVFASFVNAHAEAGTYAMLFDGEETLLDVPSLSFGSFEDQASQARILFDSLRRCDEVGAKTVYVRSPKKDGIGLAVYNRLLRAAGFEIITPE